MIRTSLVRGLLAIFFLLGMAAGAGVERLASAPAALPAPAASVAALPPAASNGLPWAAKVDIQRQDHENRLLWQQEQLTDARVAIDRLQTKVHDLELVERTKKAGAQ